MTIVRDVKTDFSLGIVSPAIQAKVGSEEYLSGVKDLCNMLVLPDGGIANRPGTEFITESTPSVPAGDNHSIFHSCVIQGDNYIIQITMTEILFYKNGVMIEIVYGLPPLSIITPFL